MSRVSKLKESKGRDRILSKEECEKLLNVCRQSKSPFLFPVVILAICTGIRKSEILKLSWSNVNFEEGIISLKDTKSGYPRSIPLIGSSFKER
jgi:integrase